MPNSPSEFVLYSYFRSSASHRVRLALHLKQIDFEYRPVHLLNNGGEQRQESYSKLNPSQQVPTLIHTSNGKQNIIGQSVAIVEYLDQVHPSTPLISADAFTRAICLQACEIVNSGTQPFINLKTLQELETRFGFTAEQKNDWCKSWVERGLAALETFLAPYAQEFSLGNTVSAADCFVVPQLYSAERFQVDLSKYPTLTRVRETCEALEAFKKGSPFTQVDTPADLRRSL